MTALLTLLLACNDKPVECSEEDPCGFGETCVEGECVGKSCATSDQCGMEEFCEDGECSPGCAAAADCYPGDTCEEGACVTATCEDSHVDCAFGEYCNGVTGECYEASGYYCRACETDEDCGGGGNMCLSWGLNRDFCGVACASTDDCPSGYSCLDVVDDVGNVVSQQCATYCWLYVEE